MSRESSMSTGGLTAGLHRVVTRRIMATLVGLSLAFVTQQQSTAQTPPSLVLENTALRVEFSRADGTITRLTNKLANLELITRDRPLPRPWALILGPTEIVDQFSRFRFEQTSTHDELHLHWQTPYEVDVSAIATLKPGTEALRLMATAKNRGNATIVALRYPDIQGIGPLSPNGDNDRLLHSCLMGTVFNNPLHLFRHDSAIPHERGLVVSRYPNGFHGASLQLMAYYAQGKGGFYLATEDGNATEKDLNFFKASADSLSCEFAHYNWDATRGNGLALKYPVVIAALQEGNWYEPARRYREWALKQSWCQRGVWRDRLAKHDGAHWLMQDTGAVGMWWPFQRDIRAELTRTRELYGAPLLHLELNWKHQASVEFARQMGDHFGPFYFPYLAMRGTATYERYAADEIVPHSTSISPDWMAMCCGQAGWQQVFAESAEDMVGNQPLRHDQIWMERESGCNADCLYFDIGPCAGVPTFCYAANHDHPPGAGRELIKRQRASLLDVQLRASRRKGAYVPLGTECISEPFIDVFDLCYPRNAGLSVDMELLPYVRQLTWLPDGKMSIVPLFAYLYHEYGPLAVQGIYSTPPWLTPRADLYHTWAEARSYLWGGVTTVFPVPPDTSIDVDRQHFLRSLIAARRQFAKDFLLDGRMQRPPALDSPVLTLEHGLDAQGWLYQLRFSPTSRVATSAPVSTDDAPASDSNDSPAGSLTVEQWVRQMLATGAQPATTATLAVPAIECAAYTLPGNRLGLLCVNLMKSDVLQPRLTFVADAFELPTGAYQVTRHTMDGSRAVGVIQSGDALTLNLPPRDVVLYELVREKTKAD